MLASLADDHSGTACSPAHPLDISTFFAGAPRPALMLFLSCAYGGPEATPSRLQVSLMDTGGLRDVAGMLALAHRLSADRLLRAALDWAHARPDVVYSANPTLWFRTAGELQLDLLRGRLAAWVVDQLRRSPAVAFSLLQVRCRWWVVTAALACAIVAPAQLDYCSPPSCPPQRLDFKALPRDTAEMLLDGMAASAVSPPTAAAYERWSGAGSLCLAAAAAAARAAEAAAAEAQQPAEGLDALFEAQQQQAEDDWDEAWAEAEAEAGDWDEGLPAHLFAAAHPLEAPEFFEAPEGWPEEFEAWEQQQAAAAAAEGEDGGEEAEPVGGWADEFPAWQLEQAGEGGELLGAVQGFRLGLDSEPEDEAGGEEGGEAEALPAADSEEQQ